jgi:hypothetical protein
MDILLNPAICRSIISFVKKEVIGVKLLEIDGMDSVVIKEMDD